MIGVILENGESAVELFHQNHAREFVRQRHLSQGQRKSGPSARLVAETITAANREQKRNRVELLALQKLGQLFGGKLLSPRIEKDQLVPLILLLLLPVAARQRQNCRFVFQGQARNFCISGDAFQILISKSLDRGLFCLADPGHFNLHWATRGI